MTEYIDREEAIKAIAEDKIEMTPELIAIGRAIGTYTAEQAFDGINQACDRHIESIKIIPAADVQPVKHGKWENGVAFHKVCSKCNCIIVDPAFDEVFFGCGRLNYCPNCGAKMDGEING